MKNSLSIIVLSMCLGATPGLAAAQPQPIADLEVLEAVETQLLADDVVTADLIDVNVEAGVVTLSGKAFTLLAKRRATTLAASLKGVRAIVNRIDVTASARSDEQVFADVQATLRDDPVADHEQVKVTVGEGRVTLDGTVDSYAEKQLVETAIIGVRGVTDVDNRLNVLVNEVRPDNEIQPEIARRFELSPYLAEGLIDVDVENGVVTLAGAVGSVAEKGTAELLSWVAGVRNVDVSGLEVKWWLRNEMKRGDAIVLRNEVQLQRAVEDSLLYDPRVRGMKIDVAARQGAVWLLGHVASLSAKRAAERDAQNTLGVRRVVNRLKVRPEHWPGDPAVTKSANAALARDAHVGDIELRASSHFGKVYLRGEVNTPFERRRAEAVAANVPGSLAVVNRIKVDTQWQFKPDAEIRADVERRLQRSAVLDADRIRVLVADGVVTLRGKVDSWHDAMIAGRHAHQSGARRVINELDPPSGGSQETSMKKD